MERDARKRRGERPFAFASVRGVRGAQGMTPFTERQGGPDPVL
jgi:hypothetical protein